MNTSPTIDSGDLAGPLALRPATPHESLPRPAARPARTPASPVGRLRTVPNGITLARTVMAVALAVVGIAHQEPTTLLIGYAIYWVGDVADGWSARALRQETRLGAVLDIVGDRASTALLAAGALALYPELWPLAALYLTSFLVVDTMLSLAFLAWPLLSPNDFHQIDERVWRLNWWPPAKCLNTAAVVVLVVVGLTPIAYVVCLTVLGIKVWSCARVLDLLGSRT